MSVPMPVGLFDWFPSSWGKGPGDDTVGPLYSAAFYIPQVVSIQADIATADANNILWFAQFSDSSGAWTDLVGGKKIFNLTKYTAQVKRFTVAGGATQAQADAVLDALTRRRMIAYVIDEPHHAQFGGSIPKDMVNQICLLHKQLWPGCITVVREDSFNLTPAPPGGWTGLDYGWAQFDGKTSPAYMPAIGRNFETFSQFYAREKADFAAINLGMIPGMNLLDAGLKADAAGFPPACWDYLNNGTSSGYIGGSIPGSAISGQGYACGTLPVGTTDVAASPAMMQASIDAVFNDPDAPAFLIYSHPRSNFLGLMIPFEQRADTQAGLDYVITKANSRVASNGWRAAKGAAGGGGGGQISTSYTYQEVTTRQTSAIDTYVDVPGATLAANQFVAGHDYFVFITAQVDYNSTSRIAYSRMLHGSTPFADSELIWQPEYTGERMCYAWFGKWTAIASERLQLQIRQETGQVLTVGADQVSMFALDLTGLSANAWKYNESSADTALTTAFQDGATLTFTPVTGAHDWLVLTFSHIVTPSQTNALVSGLRRAGEAISTDPESQSTWRGTNAARLMNIATACVKTLGAVSQTFAEECKQLTAATAHRTFSKVFCLDLSAFAAHAAVYSTAELDFSGTAYATQAQTAAITPTVQAPVWMLAAQQWVAGVLGFSLLARMQVDNVDQPPTQTADVYSFMTAHNAADIPPVQFHTVETLSAAVHNIDLDSSQGSPAAGRGGKQRMIAAIQLSASVVPPTPPATPDQVVQAGNKLDLTFVASDPVVPEANLIYSAVSTLPPGSNFDPLTRRLQWTPTNFQVGTYVFTFRVSNGTVTADWSFQVNVTPGAVEPGTTPDITNNVRYDSNLQGGRINLIVSWNSGGTFLTAAIKQGISGVLVHMSDMKRMT